MSNSKTLKGPQGPLQQLSWTVTGLIQIRLSQIQRLFKTTRDTPTVVMDCYWARTAKVMSNSKTFQGPQGTLQQLSWTVTGLIQIR